MIDTLTLSRELDQGRPPVRAHADAIRNVRACDPAHSSRPRARARL